MNELTDENRQNLRTRFISDISVLERALLRYSPQPSEEVRNAQVLITGLLKGALESDEFTRSLYLLAYTVPMETN